MSANPEYIGQISEWTGQTPAPLCPGPANIGLCQTIGRTLIGYVRGTGNSVHDVDNARLWLSRYDLSQIPWGYIRNVGFDSPASLVPDESLGDYAGWYLFSDCELYTDPFIRLLANQVDIYRTQIALNAPAQYMVIGVGFDATLSRLIAAQGCNSALPTNNGCAGPTILELPIPDVAVGYDCEKYVFGLVGSNPLGQPTGTYTDLTQFMNVFDLVPGSKWNTNQSCQLPTGDPFLEDTP